MWKSSKMIGLFVCAGIFTLPASAFQLPTTRIGFDERAATAGLSFNHVQIPLRPWAVMGTGGVAADFNNDGWCDLYVIGGGETFDALFINQGLGAGGRVHFTDESAAWGIRTQHYGFGSSAADYDNDGDMDIFVTTFGDPASSQRIGQHRLYRNDLLPDGSRVFVEVAQQAGVNQLLPGNADGTGSAWGDPDLDGDLDLFVSSYLPTTVGNRMFRNNGDGTFSDVTTLWGMDAPGCSGFVPGFVDIYGNRRPDLLIVADTGTSRVYINRGPDANGVPQFVERAQFFDGLSTANGMGSAVGDLNKDGMLDWYVSSIYFDSTQGPGNVLMIQGASRSFTNVAFDLGVADGRWGWGVLMVDFDNDRDLDLAEVNGWPVAFNNIEPFLFEQTAPMQFTDVHTPASFNKVSEGRGLVNADFDNDGDQDMVVFNVGSALNYYENTLIIPGRPVPPDANWLRIDLDTSSRSRIPPNGMHTSITVSAGGEEQLVCIDGGFSHCSQGEIGAHVGLGNATTVDWIRIGWIDGSNTTIENIPANQILKVSATPYAADLNNDGFIDNGDIFTLLNAYLSSSLAADINGNGVVDEFDLIRYVDQFISGF